MRRRMGIAQVIKDRRAPLAQCGREVATGLFESARGGSANPRGLFDDETAQIAVGVSDVESIPRRRAWQHRVRVDSGVAEEAAQVGYIGLDAGSRCGHRRLAPDGV